MKQEVFMDKLDVDQEVADILIEEGFNTLELGYEKSMSRRSLRYCSLVDKEWGNVLEFGSI